MAISRRRFIKAGTLTAIAASLAFKTQILAFGQTNTPGFPVPLTAQQKPTFLFTKATFEPYVGSFFQAPNASGQMVSLRLVSVTDYKPSTSTTLSTASPRNTESFSLMFQASGSLPEYTSIHRVSHAALGEFDLFLNLKSSESGQRVYEAVFNHL